MPAILLILAASTAKHRTNPHAALHEPMLPRGLGAGDLDHAEGRGARRHRRPGSREEAQRRRRRILPSSLFRRRRSLPHGWHPQGKEQHQPRRRRRHWALARLQQQQLLDPPSSRRASAIFRQPDAPTCPVSIHAVVRRTGSTLWYVSMRGPSDRIRPSYEGFREGGPPNLPLVLASSCWAFSYMDPIILRRSSASLMCSLAMAGQWQWQRFRRHPFPPRLEPAWEDFC